MGARASSFSSGNDVFVWTTKPAYVSGETVTGTLNLNCIRQFPSTGVYVTVRGVERTQWEERKHRQVEDGQNEDGSVRYRREEYTESHYGRHVFFDQRICIRPWGGYCFPGQYQFPFSFQLPAGLPGVFEARGTRWNTTYEAETLYHIIGEVDCADGSEIKHHHRLIMHAAPPSSIQAQTREETANIYVCCCINRGSVTMNASFNKNAFLPGETAQVICNVQNRSTSEITGIETLLKRRFRMSADGGHHFERVDTIAQATYAGVAAAPASGGAGSEALLGDEGVNSGNRFIPLALNDRDFGAIQPSTHGQRIQCEYWVEVHAMVTCSGGIRIDLPVTIYAPQPQQWVVPTLAGWQPQVFDGVTLNLAQGTAVTISGAPLVVPANPMGAPVVINAPVLSPIAAPIAVAAAVATAVVSDVVDRFADPYLRYTIESAHAPGKFLNVVGDSSSNGAKIILWHDASQPNSQWHIKPAGGGAYNIVNAHSGKCVNVSGAAQHNGADILQWDNFGDSNSQFRINSVGDAFTLQAIHSSKYINVAGASTEDGAKIHQWDNPGSRETQWYIRLV